VSDRLVFGVAASPEELDAVFRLRYRVAVEYGWEGGDEARGIEREEADAKALQFAVDGGGELVATARLIVEPADVAEVLREEGLEEVAAGTAVFGRLTVVRPWRHRTREIFVGLAAEMARACLERGITRAISFAAENSIRFCRMHGLPVQPVGAPRAVDGELRSPVLVDLAVFGEFATHAADDERRTLEASLATPTRKAAPASTARPNDEAGWTADADASS
jgi:N-acyl-L-homoserine lactone synthetase